MSILFYHQNYLVFNSFICLMCCAFHPPRFYRKFDLYLLRCGTKTQDMPLPREKNLICSVFRIFKLGEGCSTF